MHKFHVVLLAVSALLPLSVLLLLSCKKPESNPEVNDSEWRNISFSLATYNVAFDRPEPWVNRKEMIHNILLSNNFDIVGIQEPYLDALEDLVEMLPDYAYTGTSVTGNPEDPNCHNNPIFYKKSRFDLLDHGSFWFSETPDVPGSKSWESNGPRMCNWGKFRDIRTGNEFFLFNIHLDNKSEQAREHAADIINRKVTEIAKGYHAFLTGDFNADQWSETYSILKKEFRDTKDDAVYTENADWHSYNGYKLSSEPEHDGAQIDHIMLRIPDFNYAVNEWKLINTSYNGSYPSDHFPLAISFSFKFIPRT